MDPLREQRPAELSQGHLVLRRSVPDFEHIVTGLRVKGQELKAAGLDRWGVENEFHGHGFTAALQRQHRFPVSCWLTLPHDVSRVHFNGPGAAQVIVVGKRVAR